MAFLLSACQKEPDPETVIRKSIANFAESDRYQFDMSLNGKGQDIRGELIDFSASAIGSGNTEDRENSEGATDLSLNITTKDGTVKIAVSLQFLPGYFYAKLNDITLPGEDLPKGTKDQFLNKWWEVPISDKNPLFKTAPKEREQIIAKLETTSLFQNISKIGEEEVKGEQTRKYRADLNPHALVAFLEEATKITDPTKTLPVEEKNALLDAFKEIDFSGNMWVAKSDGSLRKLAGAVRAAPKEGGSLFFDFDASFWDYGKEITYKKPEGATPFNPALLLGLLGSLPGLAPGAAPPPVAPGTPIDNPLGAKQVKP